MALFTDERWIALKSLPSNISYGNASNLNDHEFVFASERYGGNNDCPSIYKYNVHKNEWCAFIDYPKDLKMADHGMAINKISNKMYLCEKSMVTVDLETKEFNEYSTNINDINQPFLVNANGTIHGIGGDVSSKHLTWNDSDHSFKEMHDFKTIDNIYEIYGASVIYVPSKQLILLIGGKDIWNDKMIGIWKYCLLSNKWSKVKGIQFDFFQHSAVLTSNQECIVIAGGRDKDNNCTNSMHILDIRDENNYILRKSSIQCPMSGSNKIIRSGGGIKDELLTIGWIKHLFNSSEFHHFQFPLDIMQLIAMWFCQETIHWMEREDVADREASNHFAINLKHIF